MWGLPVFCFGLDALLKWVAHLEAKGSWGVGATRGRAAVAIPIFQHSWPFRAGRTPFRFRDDGKVGFPGPSTGRIQNRQVTASDPKRWGFSWSLNSRERNVWM